MSQKAEHEDGRGILGPSLPGDAQPDAAIEERIVRALHAGGVLRHSRPHRTALRAALLAAASFLIGLILGRGLDRAPRSAPDVPAVTSEPPRAEVIYIVDM